MKPWLTLLASALCLTVSLSASAATIVYDNFDPTPSPWPYALFGSWTGNFTPSNYAITATTFVPSMSGTLEELHLGLTNQKTVGSNVSVVTLHADTGGTLGASLWAGPITVSGVGGSIASITGIGGPMLTAGVTYWVAAAPAADGVTLHGWYANTQGDMGATISSGTPFANADRFALQVAVQAIPEPRSLLLAGLAVAGGAGWVRRR